MRRLHVIPIGDSGPHAGIHAASLECWCYPLWDGEVAVHHAHDCREVEERRTGERCSEGWVTIAEHV